MRSICNNLRLSLQAAFSHAVKAHLSPERMARSGKVFAIKADPVRDVPSVQRARRANTESSTPVEMGELLRYLDKLPEPKRGITNALIYLGGQRMTQLCAVPWNAVTEGTICLLSGESFFANKKLYTRAYYHGITIQPENLAILCLICFHLENFSNTGGMTHQRTCFKTIKLSGICSIYPVQHRISVQTIITSRSSIIFI